VILFKRRKSTQKRNFPSFLGALTMGEEYDNNNASMTPLVRISLICYCMAFFFAAEYRYDGRRKGFWIRHDYIVFDEAGLPEGLAVIEDVGVSCQQSFKLGLMFNWEVVLHLFPSDVVAR
jgi:hypothetical protein